MRFRRRNRNCELQWLLSKALSIIAGSSPALEDRSHRVLTEANLPANEPVAHAGFSQIDHLCSLTVRRPLPILAAELLASRLGVSDPGFDPLPSEVPLELRQRGHHRGDHLAVRRGQVELRA